MARETKEVDCKKCKGKMIVEVPQWEVQNKSLTSQLIFAHPDVVLCPHCDQPHQFCLQGAEQLHYGWLPVTIAPKEAEKRNSQIIIPPDSMRDGKKFN